MYYCDRLGTGTQNSISSCAFTLTHTQQERSCCFCLLLRLFTLSFCALPTFFFFLADCDSSAGRLHVQALYSRRGRSCHAPGDCPLHRRWKLPFQNLSKTNIIFSSLFTRTHFYCIISFRWIYSSILFHAI